jgi:acid phosphatase
MSYYDGSDLPLGQLASEHTLCDRFFQSAFGGSFLNHQYLIAAACPTWTGAPPNQTSSLASTDTMTSGSQSNVVTSDGYAVNTVQTANGPYDPAKPSYQLLPSQTHATIGDRLSAAGVSWKWYSGGWNLALSNASAAVAATFQFHHQPFASFSNYGPGTEGRAPHLRDVTEFYDDVAANNLPSVSFIKLLGPENEHPGYTDLLDGQQVVQNIINNIKASNMWESILIVYTYDELGGRWDHVAPPIRDTFGPGSGVPTVLISPLVKAGFIDSTVYETLSILKTIETKWGLAHLTARDQAAADFRAAMATSSADRLMPFGIAALCFELLSFFCR